DDSFIGFEDTAFVIAANQLLVNDTDPDPGSLSRLSVSAVGNASHGTVSLQGDGSVRFMPAQDFYGTASFQYQVSDGEGGQTWATAYLNVQAVNDAPVIEDIWYGRPIYGYRW
ncbi:cadherin-like domain-containing protein, partial [Salmonella enterica subsp. enterica serovar Enteritidis]|uniref:cadherin-like domain-containing protein n=1 Tax=Salmonella enterica TaxID=28901 RepID=UPI00165486F8